MSRIIKFIKQWTLLCAMAVGVISFYIIKNISYIDAYHSDIKTLVSSYLMPSLLFSMLFLEFNKLNPKDFFPKRWIYKLFIYQIITSVTLTCYLIFGNAGHYTAALQGIITCILTPTATAVAVMSAKLGGKAASATTYAVMSALLAAIVIPFVFPFISPSAHIGFMPLFMKIIDKVFPVIILPLLLSFLLRWKIPSLQYRIAHFAKDKSFYLWSVCIMVNMAQIVRVLTSGLVPIYVEGIYAIIALVLCLFQYEFGSWCGKRENDVVSARQSMGQKNTILSIWLALTFLDMASAIIPGAYMIWQNVINAVQLSRYGKKR